MSKLYSKVKQIINSSEEEARSLLYGSKGISYNSDEYYRSIISSFVKKKDNLIGEFSTSHSKKYSFNIDEYYTELLNILFLSNVIENTWNSNPNKLKTIEEYLRENNNKINNTIEIEGDSFNSIDENKTRDDKKKIKKAIHMLNQLRNSFEHINDYFSIDDNGLISIKNPTTNFTTTMPIEYLDGFIKGRIIAKESDKDKISKSNNEANSILKKMNINIQDIPSFFYNINPNTLSKYLDIFNNDMNKLYIIHPSFLQLSGKGLDYVIEYFKENKELVNNNIEALSDIDTSMIDNMIHHVDANKIELFIHMLDNVLKNELSNDDKLLIKSVNKRIITTLSEYIETKKLIKQEPLLIELLEHSSFDTNFIKTISLLKDSLEEEAISLFINYTVDNNIQYTASNINKLLELCKLVSIDSHKITKNELNVLLRSYPTNQHLIDNTRVIDYEKIKNLNPNKFPESYRIITFAYYSYPKYIELLSDTNSNEIIDFLIKEINNDSISHLLEYDTIIDIIYKLRNKYPLSQIFDFIETISDEYIDIETINKLLNNNLSLSEINDKIKYIKTIDKIKSLTDLLNMDENMITKNNDEIREIVLNNSTIKSPLYEYLLKFNNHNIDFLYRSISNGYKGNDEELLDIIKMIKFKDYPNIEYAIIESTFDSQYEIDLTRSKMIIDFFNFKFESEKDYLEDYDKILKYSLLKLDDSDFINGLKESIDYFDNLNNQQLKDHFIRIYTRLWSPGIKYENLDYIINYCNGDTNLIKKMPLEFFTCDISVLEEMITRYNNNISRSIFGINNPKVIALLLYMNNTLTNINNLNKSYINPDIDTILDNNYQNNTNYSYATAYNNQALPFDDKYTEYINTNKTTQEELKNLLLTKMRNSSAHFRFSLVKDESGKVLDNKIYLYDEDNHGKNFGVVFDISTALEFTHDVENELNKLNNKEKISELETNRTK